MPPKATSSSDASTDKEEPTLTEVMALLKTFQVQQDQTNERISEISKAVGELQAADKARDQGTKARDLTEVDPPAPRVSDDVRVSGLPVPADVATPAPRRGLPLAFGADTPLAGPTHALAQPAQALAPQETPLLRAGALAGPTSMPGYTPAQATPVARGVSGFLVPLTPAKLKKSVTIAADGKGQPTLLHRKETPAAERYQSALAIETTPEVSQAKEALWADCFALARAQHPNASHDEVLSITDRTHAEEWMKVRREHTLAIFTQPSPGIKSTIGTTGKDEHKFDGYRKISSNAASRITNKLKHSNFHFWASELLGIIMPTAYACEILEGIEHGPGYNPARPQESTEHYDFTLDLEIGGLISSSVSEECRGYVVNRQSTGEYRGSIIWRDLCGILQRKDAASRNILLMEILQDEQSSSEGVRPYAERLRERFLRAASMGRPFSSDEQVLYLLRGVQQYLEHAADNVAFQHDQDGGRYTFDSALQALISAETKVVHDRKGRKGRTTLVTNLLSKPAANIAHGQGDGGPRKYRVFKSRSPIKGAPGYFHGECRHCRKWGHKQDDCPDRKRAIDTHKADGDSPAARQAEVDADQDETESVASDSSSVAEGEIIEVFGENGERYLARLATGPIEIDSEANVAHARALAATAVTASAMAVKDEPKGEECHPFEPEDMLAFVSQYVPTKAIKWILDSGATHHMTHRGEILPVRVGAAKDTFVHIADGTKAPVTRRGACEVTFFGDGGSKADTMLRSVLVVPSFKNNLLSVQCLTHEGWTVQFSKHGAELKSPTGQRVETFVEPGTGTHYLMLSVKASRVINIKGVSCQSGSARASARLASMPTEEKLKDLAAVKLWHGRIGHMGLSTMRTLAKNKDFAGSDRPTVQMINNAIMLGWVCDPCVEAKQPLLPFQDSENETEEQLGKVYTDLSGPYEGNKEYKYLLNISVWYSRMKWVQCLPSKDAPTVFAAFLAWANLVENQGHGTIKALHADHGREFDNSLFEQWATKKGIAWNWTAPLTSEQNGLIERANRTIQDRGRAMLRAARLSDAFWPFAFRAACFLINRSPSAAIDNKVPLSVWTGKPIDYSELRTFGCLCWVINSPKQRKGKLAVRAIRGTYLGNAPDHKAHLVFTPGERPFLRITRHVIFDESRTYDARFTLDNVQSHEPTSGAALELVAPARGNGKPTVELDPAPQDEAVPDWVDDEQAEAEEMHQIVAREQDRGNDQDDWPSLDSLFGDDESAPTEDIATNELTGDVHRYTQDEPMSPSVAGIRNSYADPISLGTPIQLEDLDNLWQDTPTKQTIEPITGAMLQGDKTPPRRSQRLQNNFKALKAAVSTVFYACTDEVVPQDPRSVAMMAMAASLCSADGFQVEPKTLKEAMQRADWSKWKQAMDEEIASLSTMGTWSLTDLPADRQPIGCKWVFKLKLDADGKAARWKARLVAQGFSQRAGIDYSETFAPVARLAAVRVILAIATHFDLIVWSMDVVTAYLNGLLSEAIYMRQPPVFDDGSGRVCKLRLSLYGLKQSGREWYIVIMEYLVEQGFQPLKSEPCVYVKMVDGNVIIIALYVDDVLIAARRRADVDRVRAAFANRFKMTDNGPLTQILGLKVKINAQSGITTISQGAYIESMLRRFDLEKATPVDTPMTAAMQAIGPRTEGQASKTEIGEYASIIGSLLWIAQGTRPDIAYAVSRLARFMANPRVEHHQGAKRILRYLKGTANIGLVYIRGHYAQIEGFSDADHAKDLATRRSVSGYAFFVHGNLVSWRSRLQATVAVSSTESEYVAVSESSREAKWLRTFTTELGFAPRRATDIATDSTGAYSLARNPEGHNKLKHVDTHYHLVRELVQRKQVNITQVGTDDNAADIFTKVTSLKRHQDGMLQLGLGDQHKAA